MPVEYDELPEEFELEELPEGFELEEEPPETDIEPAPGFIETAAPSKPGIFSRIKEAFTGEKRKTPETEALPEFLSREAEPRETIFGTPAKETVMSRMAQTADETGLKTIAGMMATFNPERQKEIIKSNIPEAEFETDEKGNTIVNISGKRSILNKPGFSETDAAQAIATTLAFLPATKIAKLGGTLVKSFPLLGEMVAGGIAAGATEAGLGEVARATGAKKGAGLTDIGFASAMEMLIPAAGALVKRVGRGVFNMTAPELRQVEGMTPEIMDNILEAKQAVEGLQQATGKKVVLYPGQQMAVPAETMKMRIVSQLSEGSQKAYQGMSKQNVQAREITDSLIDQISKSSTITAPEQFKAASELALDALKQNRKAKASPLYKKALAAGGTPETKDIKSVVAGYLDEAEPGMPLYNQVSKIAKWLEQDPSLKKLHNAKITINDWIARKGEKSLDNTVKRALVDINEQIKKSLVDASPLYKDADAEFARLSPAIDAYQQTFLGKIAKLDPASPEIQNIAKRIFSGSEKDVRMMKKIIDDVDPNAFDTLLKSEMSENVTKAIDGFQAADALQNIPGQIGKALFGDFKRKKNMLAAMSTEQQKNFRYLETYLKRAAAGRAPGSPTAAFSEAIKKVQSPAMVIRDFFTSPIKQLQQTGETAMINTRLTALAEATYNPNWQPRLSKIRVLSKGQKINSPTVARAMAQLLNDIETSAKPQQAAKEPLRAVAQLEGDQYNDKNLTR